MSEGGIWSDLDVTCETEIAKWNVSSQPSSKLDMIIGLEFDMEYREGQQVSSQFTNWVMAARPSSRHLQYVVDSIIAQLRQIVDENGLDGFSGITLDMLSDVVDVTGPKSMTISILQSLGRTLGRSLDDRDFHGTKSPLLIGDVLILQGNAFAAAQNWFPMDQGKAYITHHYSGSWKAEGDAARERRKTLQESQTSAPG